MNSQYCQFCRDPIKWVRTPTGKHLALEPSPDPAGNIALEKRWLPTDTAGGEYRRYTVGLTLSVEDAHEMAHGGRLLWIAHAAKCSARRPKEEVPVEIIQRMKTRLKESRQRNG